MEKKYLFTSERLGFRNWLDEDIPAMTEISADADVMEFFPAKATPEQTEEFIERMKEMFSRRGFCYFAVDCLEDGEFIGFIGLCEQVYEAEFTPCIDIGWRLNKKYWNRGYATEGAKRCLQYAFDIPGIGNIKATAPAINEKSIRVMKKMGMKEQLKFRHPALSAFKSLENCVCYEIDKVIN